MRILLLNPNTTEAVTTRLAETAGRVTAPGTELVPLTAPRGFPYISSRAESQVAGAIVLEMLAAEAAARPPASAVIAAFGDPGLHAARELFDFPVVGMAEAAMLTATMLGRTFVLVTFARSLATWYQECVDLNGMGPRCAGIRMLENPFTSIAAVAEEQEAHLVTLATEAVRETDADVLIFAGAPLAGLAARVADRIPVPVVDQVQAAVKQAETLAALGVRKATAGSFQRPTPKPTTGLDAALAARFSG